MIIWKDETLYGKSHSDPLQLQEKRYKECTNKKKWSGYIKQMQTNYCGITRLAMLLIHKHQTWPNTSLDQETTVLDQSRFNTKSCCI